MAPFYIKIGPLKLIIPFQDMTKTNGVWDFTQAFRVSWLMKRYPALVPAFLEQCRQHQSVFTSIERHTKVYNLATGTPNYCRDVVAPNYSRKVSKNIDHQKYPIMNPAYKKVIQKYNLLCIQHKVRPNSVALATSLNIAGFAANDPDDESYRNIPAYSNSRIGQIKSELMRMQRDLPYKAFGLGKIVHQQLLEPQLCHINQYVLLTKAVKRDLQGMVSAAKRHPALRQILSGYEKEEIFTWFDSLTGAPCKCKVDLWREKTRGDHVIDLKTTRARSQQEFEAAAFKYEYDRQGAFYIDGTGAKRFTLYGIQKVAPYAIYKIFFTKQEDKIAAARKRYRFIISKAIQNQIQP